MLENNENCTTDKDFNHLLGRLHYTKNIYDPETKETLIECLELDPASDRCKFMLAEYYIKVEKKSKQAADIIESISIEF